MYRILLLLIIVACVTLAWNVSDVFAVPPGAGTILSQERQEITQEKIQDMRTDPPEDVEDADIVEKTPELIESYDDNVPECENKEVKQKRKTINK